MEVPADGPGRREAAALAALAATASRYELVAREAGIAFAPGGSDRFDVVERLQGSASTDFGVPGAIAARDAAPLASGERERLAALVAASWAIFDRVAASAPAALRKGPRGGGRDRDAIVAHLVEAEVAYARKLGIRFRQPPPGDAAAIAALRTAILDPLRAAERDVMVERGWPPRYAARRIAWHALDHAWEMEDRSGSGR